MATIAKKDPYDNGVKFRFMNGEVLDCNIDNLPDDIKRKLLIHGISQKVGDTYAGAETLDDAIAGAKETWKMLTQGDWTTGRAATGGLWVDAIAKAANLDRETALSFWLEKDDKQRKDLKAHPAVKAAYAVLQAERAKAKADAMRGIVKDVGPINL